jgi:tetratricopeptide (TPR) repeat protein
VGPRLKKLLFVVFGLFALLVVDSVYLTSVHALEAATGRTYQNWFYMILFLLHLVLGLLLILPVIAFGLSHIRNAYNRPNRRAVKVGYTLFGVALVLLASGIVLTRIEGVIVVKDATIRSIAYWAHVLSPLAAAWLFVLHRLAGRKIKWKVGYRWAAVAGAFALVLLIIQAQDPRKWNVTGPKSGEKYFYPSLARTATGNFIPARALMNDRYCAQCHPDVHKSWMNSVHRFSSFNNPPYFFSVSETKRVANYREHSHKAQAPRFCAGCHDPVVFFSGRFDDPKFEDPKYDLRNEPTASQGITCSVCHSITHVNSQRGNSDYTIEEPIQYPFAFSDNRVLAWVNRTLIKAKPEFHKATFLKPLHKTAEFCAGCHKVFLPKELNHYKWLRGQNHYDSFLLSGVSGHGVASFYYPPKAQANCNGCHMKTVPSNDFAAKVYDDTGVLQVHSHQFPSANTGIAHLLKLPPSVITAHEKFNEGVMRVDLFGVKDGGTIDSPLTAPLRPAVPALKPGRSYLLEAVVRTVKMGHHFTQGTADSNEVWLDVTVTSGGKVIGRSGGMGPDGSVDPWSHFFNVYMLDREGHRVDRRNAQDIFTPLYNHQIPPGAADVIHYRIDLPRDLREPVTVEAKLRYRKFDTIYMKKVYANYAYNDLPVMLLASDKVTFPVAGGKPAVGAAIAEQKPPVIGDDAWQRWNDYGIALLLKGGKSKGELAQAEDAFAHVEAMGKAAGPLNLARLYIEQGTVQDKAIAALQRATAAKPPAPPWSISWFSGQVDKQNGRLDEAIANYESLLNADNAALRERGFDFSKDYRLLVELGETLVERSRLDRGPQGAAQRQEHLRRAAGMFERALALDPENTAAHYNLALVYRQLGDAKRAQEHKDAFDKYRPDDNARDRAISIARAADPAANHAAEAIVIYDLRRPGAYELGPGAPAPRPAVPESIPASGGP